MAEQFVADVQRGVAAGDALAAPKDGAALVVRGVAGCDGDDSALAKQFVTGVLRCRSGQLPFYNRMLGSILYSYLYSSRHGRCMLFMGIFL